MGSLLKIVISDITIGMYKPRNFGIIVRVNILENTLINFKVFSRWDFICGV